MVDPHTVYYDSDAVLELAVRLSGLPTWVRQLARVVQKGGIPRRIRQAAYQVVSQHRRYLGGSSDRTQSSPQCRVDLDPSRFLDAVVVEELER